METNQRGHFRKIIDVFDCPRGIAVISALFTLVVFLILWRQGYLWYQAQLLNHEVVIRVTGLIIGGLLALLAYLLTNRHLRMAAGIKRRTNEIASQLEEQERSQETIRQYAERLQIQSAVDRAILAAHSPKDIAQAALEHFRHVSTGQETSILLFDFEEGEASILATSVDQDTKPLVFSKLPLTVIEFIDDLKQGDIYHKTNFQTSPNPLSLDRYLVGRGIRDYICVPMISRGELIGSLNLGKKEPGGYPLETVEIAQEVADSLAVAIQQAQLFEAEARRRREAENLRKTLEALTSDLDHNQVLNSILVYLEEVIPYDSACLFLLKQDYLCAMAARGFDDVERVVGHAYSLEKDVLFQQIQKTGRPLILNENQIRQYFQGWGGTQGVRSWMCVPLIARGKVIGCLTVDSYCPKAYKSADVTLTQSFASQAAVALENARLFSEARHLAVTDELTGIANRRQLFDLGQREVSRALRFGRPLSVIMFDVDHFKQVNDTYGHQVGDQVLRAVIKRCRKHIRDIDIIGRYGGDEFAILLPETSIKTARSMAERLLRLVDEGTYSTNCGALKTTISIGVAALSDFAPDLDSLLNDADMALYAAKEAGRNCVFAYSVQLDSWV